jgi:type 1 glutamine amidotransferase
MRGILAVAAIGVCICAAQEGPGVATSRPADSRRIRTAVAGLLGWQAAISGATARNLTFLDAAAKNDALGLAYTEGFRTQKVSPDLPRDLGPGLSSSDMATVKNRLAALKIKVSAYHVSRLGPDEDGRLIFAFAKDLGAETIVADVEPASLAGVDRLAGEFGVNVALDGPDPTALAASIRNRSPRIGAAVDLAAWGKKGIKPSAGFSALRDRVMVVDVDGNPSAWKDAFLEIARLMPAPIEDPNKCSNCSRRTGSLQPVALGVEADPSAIERFEKAARFAMGYRVEQISALIPIAGADKVPVEDRAKIEAAAPKKALVAPRKPRKLLVVDLCPAGGYYHATIANANFALEVMAKNTGAYQPVFSNDLNNLKYPKIKDYDAVFLNSVVGEVFPAPDVLDGLLRFVREGGGVAGVHGATYASMDLREYGDMMGAEDGPHHVEPAVLRVEDTNSPLTRSLLNSNLTNAMGGREFAWTDEFYHFLPEGSYSRDKLHVLLSIDTSKSDMSKWHVRPDNDYGLSWVRSYGKGRVFNCALGHTPDLLERPETAQFILAAVQFVLGDLDVDTTPSARLARK